MKIFNLRVIFNDEYVGLKAECERQSVIIDKTTAERNKEHKKVIELEKVVSTYKESISILEKDLQEQDSFIKKQAKLIEEKEKARKSNASKIGGYSKENHKLRDKLEGRDNQIKQLEEYIEKLKSDKQKLEEDIKKLEETNTFLKTHRRAPDIEEIKDYTLHRRRKVKKAS